MLSKKRFTIMSAFLAIMLCISLASVNSALADDGTPTEPAAATEPSIESDLPGVETVSTPLPPQQTPTDAVAPAEDVTITELLSEVSDNTDLVVLDENGEELSLASEAADQIIQVADPIWCPEGQAPTIGLNGCTSSFGSIFLLLDDMDTNPGDYAANGIIYVERTQSSNPATTITSVVIIDNSTYSNLFTNLNSYNLTIQGGWNTVTGAITGQTNFSSGAYLQVGSSANPWAGNVTINDIEFQMQNVNTANALTVYTTSGDINLSNIEVLSQQGNNYAAYLQSDSGDITSDSGSLFDNRNSPGHESQGFYAQTDTGSIILTDTTFQDSLGTGVTSNNGANLSAANITLNDVISRDNDGNGIVISNANVVTLNNVTSGVTPSDTNPGNGLSGVLVNGTGSTVVNVNGGTFTFNGSYGVELNNAILNEQSAPTCSDNGFGTVLNPCYNVPPAIPTSPPTDTPTNTPPTNPTNTPVPTSTASPSNGSGGSGGVIPANADELIDTSCLKTANAFGIAVTFFNLCNYQNTLNRVDADNLPGALPNGASFVMGLEVLALNRSQDLKSLPDGAGIEMDFPLLAGSQDEFAVLYWDAQSHKWIEISQQINSDTLSEVLSADTADELYHLTQTTDGNLYKILTTEKTGIFVLVQK